MTGLLPSLLSAGLLYRLLRIFVGLVLTVVLALGVAAALVVMRQPPPPIEPAPSTLMAIPLELPAGAASRVAGEMVRRPLLWASRRPLEAVETPTAAPVAGPDVIDNVKLLGLFASGSQSGVIIRLEGERRRLMVGGSVGDWQLLELSGNQAVFVRDGNAGAERRIKLEHATPAARLARGQPGEPPSSTQPEPTELPSPQD